RKIILIISIISLFGYYLVNIQKSSFMQSISIISLFGYYLVNIQKSSFMQSLPEFLNLNNVPYQGVYLFFYIPWIPERNLGIFWEPGLFATFLVIGLLFELFFNNKKISIFRVIIFSLTIFTTQSSAGYLLLFIVSVAFFINFIYCFRRFLYQFYNRKKHYY
uniref:hypothetical protein n=1 Tax=Exiguobacterium sp. AM39-5BH TaxID=2292355 RepID=UPI000FF138CB